MVDRGHRRAPRATELRALHRALLDIVSVMNRPSRDEVLIREARISLDRGLFPLLVGVGRFGPIAVHELADRAGRDPTTVSRQLARLESLGLVRRRGRVGDHRVRDAELTERGRVLTQRVDAARERLGRSVFRDWGPRDVAELVRLVRRFADAIAVAPAFGARAGSGSRT